MNTVAHLNGRAGQRLDAKLMHDGGAFGGLDPFDSGFRSDSESTLIETSYSNIALSFSGFLGAKGGGVKACMETTAGATVWMAMVAPAK